MYNIVLNGLNKWTELKRCKKTITKHFNQVFSTFHVKYFSFHIKNPNKFCVLVRCDRTRWCVRGLERTEERLREVVRSGGSLWLVTGVPVAPVLSISPVSRWQEVWPRLPGYSQRQSVCDHIIRRPVQQWIKAKTQGQHGKLSAPTEKP